MKISELLNMDADACIDWLEKNQHDVVLAPRELTKPMRIAFHRSMDRHDAGREVKGCPDDQWDAMMKVMEDNR